MSISSTRSMNNSRPLTQLLSTPSQMHIIPISNLELPINHKIVFELLLNSSWIMTQSSLLMCVRVLAKVDEKFINRTSVSLCSIKFSHYFVSNESCWSSYTPLRVHNFSRDIVYMLENPELLLTLEDSRISFFFIRKNIINMCWLYLMEY